ncbi:MAG TPA: helix-turn-helix transcriptional regulator [Parafilimonas sp.]|nr:helix-turn-helix transcriptional regulator [Parafilimonas sp.]
MHTDTEMEQPKQKHRGRQLQRVREMLGVKQLTLAAKTNLSQQYISKLEQSETIADDVLEQLAQALEVPADLIRNFDEEKAIYNIQSNNIYNDHAYNSSQHYQPTINHNPIDEIAELFQKLLESEKEKVQLLTKANDAILELQKQNKELMQMLGKK